MTPLRIRTRIDADGVAIISTHGQIDLTNSGDLAAAMTTALAANATTHVIVDLDEVMFLDMMGLSELLTAHTIAEHHGKTVQVAHAHGVVRRVLTLTSTDHLLTAAAHPTPDHRQ